MVSYSFFEGSVIFELVRELLLDEIPFPLPKSRETKDAGVFNGIHLGDRIPSYTSSFAFVHLCQNA